MTSLLYILTSITTGLMAYYIHCPIQNQLFLMLISIVTFILAILAKPTKHENTIS